MAADKKVLVYSIYPAYRLCLDKEEKELRERTDGKVFYNVVKPAHDIEFAKHRAWVTPEDAAKIKLLKAFGYGFDFILATELKELYKTNKNHATGFIKKIHRNSVLANLRPPVEEMDILEEMGTLGQIFNPQPAKAEA